jgi:hypothetical protein
MSLAVLGVFRDQIMGNSGHLTRIFFPHHFQTPRPPQTPPENKKKNGFSGFPNFPVFTVFPAQTKEKRSPEIAYVGHTAQKLRNNITINLLQVSREIAKGEIQHIITRCLSSTPLLQKI